MTEASGSEASSLLGAVKVTVPDDVPAPSGLDAVVKSAKSAVDQLGFHLTTAGTKVGENTRALADHVATNAGPTAKKVQDDLGSFAVKTRDAAVVNYGTLSTEAVKAAEKTKELSLQAAEHTKYHTIKTIETTRELSIKTIETTKEKAGPIIEKVKADSVVAGTKLGAFLKQQASDLTVNQIFVISQGILFIFFLFGATYDKDEFDVKEFIAFRDIMAMLLLGFGYLMTFLKKYGLSAVGFTMMLSVLSMELNIFVELLVRSMAGQGDWPLKLGMDTLIDAEFAAATLMITFGALIGRTTPLQMLMVCVAQSFFYAINKVWFVFGWVGAEDVGGSMTIHMFGAFFGLAVSYVLGGPKDDGAVQTSEPDKVSDLLTLIGTAVLWIFWPSFVGATETGVIENEKACVMNTIVALIASTAVTFFLSQYTSGTKFDPVHIANSTLAGGVAIGCVGRLDMGPGFAMMVGALAGAASVYGYIYSSPYLESKYGIFDTCGVGNLHGLPSLVGGVLSIFIVAFNTDADFIVHNAFSQMVRQLVAIVFTLAISVGSGYGTGRVIKLKDAEIVSYHDGMWWHTEYYPAMGASPVDNGGYETVQDVEKAIEEAAEKPVAAKKAAAEPPAKKAETAAPIKKVSSAQAAEPPAKKAADAAPIKKVSSAQALPKTNDASIEV